MHFMGVRGEEWGEGDIGVWRRYKSWGKEQFSGGSLNPFASDMHRHEHSSPGYLTKLISN